MYHVCNQKWETKQTYLFCVFAIAGEALQLVKGFLVGIKSATLVCAPPAAFFFGFKKLFIFGRGSNSQIKYCMASTPKKTFCLCVKGFQFD